MPFQLGALNKRLATLSADVHTWSMRVQVLAHRSVVPEQLATTLQCQQHQKLSMQTSETRQQEQIHLKFIITGIHRNWFVQMEQK